MKMKQGLSSNQNGGIRIHKKGKYITKRELTHYEMDIIVIYYLTI